MKFSFLKIGQEFEYKGKHYIKTTPLVATLADSDQQKLIPRSAKVSLVSESKTEHPIPATAPLEAERVRAAFEKFSNSLDSLIDELEARLDKQSLDLLHAETRKQRQHFLFELGLV